MNRISGIKELLSLVQKDLQEIKLKERTETKLTQTK
jgi:hypothetical protein